MASLPIVYRVKNNPDARGFYAAAYVSHPVEHFPDMRTLKLIERVNAGTRKAADKAYLALKAKHGECTA